VGLFSKVKDAQQQAAAAMQQAGGMGAGAGMAGMPGMGGQDMAAMAAHSQMLNKIHQTGIEAAAVINAIRATGTPDVAGATMHEFDVTITPAGAAPYAGTVQQSMLPVQMEGLSVGQAVVVKYDPDNPTAALLHTW